MKHQKSLIAAIGLALVSPTTAWAAGGPAADAATPLPRIETRNGRHALIVDGAPFFMLGAQANNAVNYPAYLDTIWPVLDRIHANTLEVPVAWQQIEPVEGQFDFSYLGTLLDQARQHDKRLVLLWFGTWKNTNYSYTPDWVKLDNRRFPRMKRKDGEDHQVLSAHGANTLASDKRAFVKLMEYIRAHDARNTVIMVQVENETGSYRLPRDHGAEAERLFAQPIPTALARATGRTGTWSQAFGAQADRYFNTWYTASYVNEIARAGKAIKPLPMYVNAALAGPSNLPDPDGVASGGPQQDVIDVWKAAAPAIDLAAPDIYDGKSDNVLFYMDKYNRPDNALMVPEIGNSVLFGRYFYPALGRGAIGFSPFGMDLSGYMNYPLGAKELDDKTLGAFALPYSMLAPMMRDWAKLAMSHPTWGGAKPDDGKPISTTMGNWTISGDWGEWQFGMKEWTFFKADPTPAADKPVGGFAVMQLSDDEFLLIGDHVRVNFAPAAGSPGKGIMLRAEEGRMVDGKWVMTRIWNGDQTDYGLNLTDRPQVLKVTMGHYR
ncbi:MULTISPECIES: DUF5597 domain-containing protein [unclassified Novosphingobium]|uniref:DUF5597 domain-containing protein n=1 Tax=unclassified Novosphingobium TaxID=2644732 RepID=UPI00146B2C57|nr:MULTISPECIES: DUF5597 domain-containing protein [unclassified Novosphingobium]NMN04624.1 beta-galactosidase GanA [Novosphingobium sp. SG919]NMN85383.1 beta-galactosidase GanA [Novosphingobium sp. SG916]